MEGRLASDRSPWHSSSLEPTNDLDPSSRGPRARPSRAAAMKRPMASASLTPGARSTPDDTSTPGAPVSRRAAATRFGAQAAGEQPGRARPHPAQQGPVERFTVAAGQRGAGRRAGVEQQVVGHRLEGGDGAEVGARGEGARPPASPAARTCPARRPRARGVSVPCSCSRSGCSASTIAPRVASSASTVSATMRALPSTRATSRRATPGSTWRGLRGKTTKPTMSAPASSAASSVTGSVRPQIFTMRDIGLKGGVRRSRCGRARVPTRCRPAAPARGGPPRASCPPRRGRRGRGAGGGPA